MARKAGKKRGRRRRGERAGGRGAKEGRGAELWSREKGGWKREARRRGRRERDEEEGRREEGGGKEGERAREETPCREGSSHPPERCPHHHTPLPPLPPRSHTLLLLRRRRRLLRLSPPPPPLPPPPPPNRRAAPLREKGPRAAHPPPSALSPRLRLPPRQRAGARAAQEAQRNVGCEPPLERRGVREPIPDYLQRFPDHARASDVTGGKSRGKEAEGDSCPVMESTGKRILVTTARESRVETRARVTSSWHGKRAQRDLLRGERERAGKCEEEAVLHVGVRPVGRRRRRR
eukprot:2632904-Rhodomonas_salina.2